FVASPRGKGPGPGATGETWSAEIAAANETFAVGGQFERLSTVIRWLRLRLRQIRMKRYREVAAIRSASLLSVRLPLSSMVNMDLFGLTRALVDIDSTSGHEKAVTDYLFAHLSPLAAKHNARLERQNAAPDRDNLFLSFGDPVVTLSTHLDTVPPFFSSHEDGTHIHGRGSCDAKGIIAAMIAAAESLLTSGTRNFALLFVVGEERNSIGAKTAAATPRGSRFLINGEPTENQLALGSKGVLRFELT